LSFGTYERLLAVVIAGLVVLFGATARNFATAGNAVELVRLSGEIGLLAIALTPVMITGGIDLSVGSLMGLSAVAFGLLWRDAHLPIWLAFAITLLLGSAAGALNAVLIARFRLPALVVTLGTFSLFRGLAEGVTGGADFVSGLPAGFLWLGQSVRGGVPPQLVLLAIAAVSYGYLLHRTIAGRRCYAIGWSYEGAKYAGLPVVRQLTTLYVLSGVMAALAGLLYVSRIGQAKSDAGTGYELLAIAATVLGGTSIAGGRGTVAGTLLGVAGIAILQNGLRLADAPAELAGILTGALLLVSITAGKRERSLFSPARPEKGDSPLSPAAVPKNGDSTHLSMKNAHIAILCGAILAAAAIVAGSNWWLAQSIERLHHSGASSIADPATTSRPMTIAMMPKAKGDPYFVSCRLGADEAARALGVNLIWDGPTDLDPARQNEVVESWITRGVDAIAVSVENKASISTVLRKAKARGIKVLAWDADAEPGARDVFINQATPEGIGRTLMDRTAALLGGRGDFAIVTASLSAANQNEWIKHIRARMAERYPRVRLVAIQPSDGDRDRAFLEAQNILKVYPNVRVIMGIAAPAVPGIAEAVRQSGRTDVKVTGLSLPNMCKPYVRSGIIDSIVLWNTRDLGFLTVHAAHALVDGSLSPASTSLAAGRLGTIQVKGDQVLLGEPFVFTKENIEGFDF
jgi:rhamnose transport system substrate-binding protein